MPRHVLARRMSIALIAVFVRLSGTSNAVAQTSKCLTNADTVAIHIAAIKNTLKYTDSTQAVQSGIPFNPANVTLVSTSSKCNSAITSYNNKFPANDPGRISRAYLFRVGTTAYAMVPTTTPLPNSTYYFMNNSYQIAWASRSLD